MKTLILSLVLFSQVSLAAKFKKIENATDFSSTQKTMKMFCESIEQDCYVNVYKIISKKPQEKWEQTLKQIIHSSGYVDGVAVERITSSGIIRAVNDLLDAAYVEEDRDQKLGLLVKRLDYDLDDSVVSLYAGGYSGEFSLSHNFIALLDKFNQEIIFIGAGYSE